MDLPSLIRLLSLAAIWGASFLFMRITAPILGTVLLTEARLFIAALFLLIVAFWLNKQLNVRENWRHYLTLGSINSALPFLLFGYAAYTLSASLLSIINATAPIWGTLISAVLTRTMLTKKIMLGLILGVSGVALLVGFDPVTVQPGAGLAVLAALAATFLYGVGSVYAKTAKNVGTFSNAHGSMWAAAIIIMPIVPFFPAVAEPGSGVLFAIITLGVLCSGVGYLLYFRLINDLGAPSALTVTFLIPVFGILWGRLFLGEPIGWHTVAGSAIVILGTALVTNFSYSRLLAPGK
jgi:drug/metabolite transporter (DMT)-like permease